MLRGALAAIVLVLGAASFSRSLGDDTLAEARMGGAAPAIASATHAMRVRDEGHLRFVTDDATLIVDEGAVSGTLPGRARVYFTYNGSPNVSARFAIHTAGGSIDGSARCRLHNPNSPTPSFRGALQITGGSGRYAHASGSGELFGVFHRHGYGLVVQAIGRLRY
jgi:hypothetical protein